MKSFEPLVQLGFSEPIPSDDGDADSSYVAHYSPNWSNWDGGKIGGLPSWLNPRDLPQEAPFRCGICASRRTQATHLTGDETKEQKEMEEEGTILRFVAQIYSPVDKETRNQHAFHRTLYIFCCPHPLCSSSLSPTSITNHVENGSVLVLRGQLARSNCFYPNNCEEDENYYLKWNKHKSESWGVRTCVMCKQLAVGGKCPKSQRYFCCKDHQRDFHKLFKNKNASVAVEDVSPYLYTESELVVEEEPSEGNGQDNNGRESCEEQDQLLVEKFNKSSLFASGSKGVDDNNEGVEEDENDELLEQSDLNEMTGLATIGGGTSDPLTMEFYTRIGRADGDVKSQCLRYCRWPSSTCSFTNSQNGESDNGPLWIKSHACPSGEAKNDIPPCEYCGSERRFEFQLMPQMVNFLLKGKNRVTDGDDDAGRKSALLAASDIMTKAEQEGSGECLPDGFEERQKKLVKKLKNKLLNGGKTNVTNGRMEDIDWGTIAIYTCTRSCGDEKASDKRLGVYRKEFAWRQPPLDSEVDKTK